MAVTVPVAELFKFLLQNSLAHQEQFENDVFNDYLPATLLNRRIIANNAKSIFADNPELDVDHIDKEYDRPLDDVSGMSDDDYLKYQQDYVKGATDAQIKNPKLAEQMKRNFDKRMGYYDNLQENRKLNKNDTAIANAWYNYDKLRLDRMLSNLFKRKDLDDDSKSEAALRLIYNNATRRFGVEPADLKIDQDDLFESVPLKVVDALQAKEPGYLEKQRVSTDTIPMTYASDKVIGDEGQEHSIFSPTSETNIIYNMFVEKLLKDIQRGDAPDPDDLPQYITKLYSDRLRTMPFTEWQKILDNEAEELNKRKAEQLGRDLKESEKIELDIPDYALTPEDRAIEMDPDKYKVGKTATEKADNKLNRWHGQNKEEYKAYLDAMANTRAEGKDNYDKEMDMVIQAIIQYIVNKGKDLPGQIDSELALGHTDKARELQATANLYKDIMSGSDTGITALNNWATVVLSNSYRDLYDINDRTESSNKTLAALEEMRNNMNDPDTPSWAKAKYEEMDNNMKKAKQLAAEQDDIAQKEYKGMSGKDIKKAMLGKHYMED
jgi:hypothetical protein